MAAEKNSFPVNGTSALKAERNYARTMGQAHIIEFDAVRRSRINMVEYQQAEPYHFLPRLKGRVNLRNIKAVLIDAMQPRVAVSREDRKAFAIGGAVAFFMALVALGVFG